MPTKKYMPPEKRSESGESTPKGSRKLSQGKERNEFSERTSEKKRTHEQTIGRSARGGRKISGEVDGQREVEIQHEFGIQQQVEIQQEMGMERGETPQTLGIGLDSPDSSEKPSSVKPNFNPVHLLIQEKGKSATRADLEEVIQIKGLPGSYEIKIKKPGSEEWLYINWSDFHDLWRDPGSFSMKRDDSQPIKKVDLNPFFLALEQGCYNLIEPLLDLARSANLLIYEQNPETKENCLYYLLKQYDDGLISEEETVKLVNIIGQHPIGKELFNVNDPKIFEYAIRRKGKGHLITAIINNLQQGIVMYATKPLYFAVKYDNLAALDALLKHPNPDLHPMQDYGPEGMQPISLAIQSGNFPILLRLLEDRRILQDINAKDYDGFTPLHRAVRSSPLNFGICEILLKHGADNNVLDIFGKRPQDYLIRDRTVHAKFLRMIKPAKEGENKQIQELLSKDAFRNRVGKIQLVGMDDSLFGHINLDPKLLGTKLQSNHFSNTMGYTLECLDLIRREQKFKKEEAAQLDQIQKKFEFFYKLSNLRDNFVTEVNLAANPILQLADARSGLKRHHKIKNDLLQEIALQIDQELKEQKDILIPGGWYARDQGHAMVYGLKLDPDGNIIFSIYNSGDGLQFHEKREGLKKEKFSPVMNIKLPKGSDVTGLMKNIIEGAAKPFWDRKSFSGVDMYSIILQSLPLHAEIMPIDPKQKFITGQISGTCSFKVLSALLKSELPGKLRARVKFEIKLQSIIDYYSSMSSSDRLQEFAVRQRLYDAIANLNRNIEKRVAKGEDIKGFQTAVDLCETIERNLKYFDALGQHRNGPGIESLVNTEAAAKFPAVKSYFATPDVKSTFKISDALAFEDNPIDYPVKFPYVSFVSDMKLLVEFMNKTQKINNASADLLFIKTVEDFFINLPIQEDGYWKVLQIKAISRAELEILNKISTQYAKKLEARIQGAGLEGYTYPRSLVAGYGMLAVQTRIGEEYFRDPKLSYYKTIRPFQEAALENAIAHATYINSDPNLDQRLYGIHSYFARLKKESKDKKEIGLLQIAEYSKFNPSDLKAFREAKIDRMNEERKKRNEIQIGIIENIDEFGISSALEESGKNPMLPKELASEGAVRRNCEFLGVSDYLCRRMDGLMRGDFSQFSLLSYSFKGKIKPPLSGDSLFKYYYVHTLHFKSSEGRCVSTRQIDDVPSEKLLQLHVESGSPQQLNSFFELGIYDPEGTPEGLQRPYLINKAELATPVGGMRDFEQGGDEVSSDVGLHRSMLQTLVEPELRVPLTIDHFLSRLDVLDQLKYQALLRRNLFKPNLDLKMTQLEASIITNPDIIGNLLNLIQSGLGYYQEGETLLLPTAYFYKLNQDLIRYLDKILFPEMRQFYFKEEGKKTDEKIRKIEQWLQRAEELAGTLDRKIALNNPDAKGKQYANEEDKFKATNVQRSLYFNLLNRLDRNLTKLLTSKEGKDRKEGLEGAEFEKILREFLQANFYINSHAATGNDPALTTDPMLMDARDRLSCTLMPMMKRYLASLEEEKRSRFIIDSLPSNMKEKVSTLLEQGKIKSLQFAFPNLILEYHELLPKARSSETETVDFDDASTKGAVEKVSGLDPEFQKLMRITKQQLTELIEEAAQEIPLPKDQHKKAILNLLEGTLEEPGTVFKVLPSWATNLKAYKDLFGNEIFSGDVALDESYVEFDVKKGGETQHYRCFNSLKFPGSHAYLQKSMVLKDGVGESNTALPLWCSYIDTTKDPNPFAFLDMPATLLDKNHHLWKVSAPSETDVLLISDAKTEQNQFILIDRKLHPIDEVGNHQNYEMIQVGFKVRGQHLDSLSTEIKTAFDFLSKFEDGRYIEVLKKTAANRDPKSPSIIIRLPRYNMEFIAKHIPEEPPGPIFLQWKEDPNYALVVDTEPELIAANSSPLHLRPIAPNSKLREIAIYPVCPLISTGGKNIDLDKAGYSQEDFRLRAKSGGESSTRKHTKEEYEAGVAEYVNKDFKPSEWNLQGKQPRVQVSLDKEGKIIASNPSDYLYLAYLAICNNRAQEAFAMLSNYQKNGGISGSRFEAQVIKWILDPIPYNVKHEGLAKIVTPGEAIATPELTAFRLSVLSMLSRYVSLQGTFDIPSQGAKGRGEKTGKPQMDAEELENSELEHFLKPLLIKIKIRQNLQNYLRIERNVPRSLKINDRDHFQLYHWLLGSSPGGYYESLSPPMKARYNTLTNHYQRVEAAKFGSALTPSYAISIEEDRVGAQLLQRTIAPVLSKKIRISKNTDCDENERLREDLFEQVREQIGAKEKSTVQSYISGISNDALIGSVLPIIKQIYEMSLQKERSEELQLAQETALAKMQWMIQKQLLIKGVDLDEGMEFDNKKDKVSFFINKAIYYATLFSEQYKGIAENFKLDLDYSGETLKPAREIFLSSLIFKTTTLELQNPVPVERMKFNNYVESAIPKKKKEKPKQKATGLSRMKGSSSLEESLIEMPEFLSQDVKPAKMLLEESQFPANMMQKAIEQTQKVKVAPLYPELDSRDYELGAKKNREEKLFRNAFVKMAADEQKLNKLLKNLQEAEATAKTSVNLLRKELLEYANKLPEEKTEAEASLAARVGLLAGNRAKLSLEDLINLYLKADRNEYRRRTHLSDFEIEVLYRKTARFLLNDTQLKQYSRALKDYSDYQSLKSDEKVSVEEKESALAKFGRTLYAKRSYDFHEFPHFLAFEYYSDILIWPEQVNMLRILLDKNRDPISGGFDSRIIQLIMAGGKSKVLMPVSAYLKAEGNNLVVMLVPPALRDSNFKDLASTSKKLFNQDAAPFYFNRDTDLSTQNLIKIRDALRDTMLKKGYIVTTSTDVQSLELRWSEMMNPKVSKVQSSPEQIKLLEEILDIFKTRGDVYVDEIDSIQDVRKEVNYPIGGESGMTSQVIKSLSDLYRDIQDFKFEFRGKRYALSDIMSGNFPKVSEREWQLLFKNVIQKNLVLHIAAKPDNRLHKILKRACSQKEASEVISYIMGERVIPSFVDDMKSPHFKDTIVLYKEQLNSLLPLTLYKTPNVQYGYSKDESRSPEERRLAIPYSGNNYPNEKSKFASPFETANYTAQLNYIYGVRQDLIVQIIQDFKTKALREREILGINMDATEAARQFREITGSTQSLFTLDLSNETTAKRLALELYKNPRVITYALETYILPSIKASPLLLRHNAQDHSALYRSFQGGSGTITTPFIFDERAKFDREMALGTDGRTIDFLVSKQTKVVAADKSILESIHGLLDTNPNFRAIIDVGSHFNGIDNVQVAIDIARFYAGRDIPQIKFILFYNSENKLCALNVQSEGLRAANASAANLDIRVLGSTDPVSIKSQLQCDPGQCFTYYDEQRATGTDIKQMSNAEAIVTFSATTQRKDLLQAVMRMRDLPRSQQVEILVSKEMAAAYPDAHWDIIEVLKRADKTQELRVQEDNFRAALQKLRFLIRSDLNQRIRAEQDMDRKMKMSEAFQALLFTEESLSPYKLFRETERIDATDHILNREWEQLMNRWKECLCAAGVSAKDTQESENALYSDMLIIREKARQVCAETQKTTQSARDVQVAVLEQVRTAAEREANQQMQKQTRQEASRQLQNQILRMPIDLKAAEEQEKFAPKTLNARIAAIKPEDQSLPNPNFKFSDLLFTSLNFVTTWEGQGTSLFDFAKKRGDCILWSLDKDNHVTATLITQKEAREFKKSMQGQEVNAWITTTKGILFTDKIPELSSAQVEELHSLQEQIYFYNGDTDSLFRDRTKLNWIFENMEEKLKFYEQTILSCHQDKAGAFLLLEQYVRKEFARRKQAGLITVAEALPEDKAIREREQGPKGVRKPAQTPTDQETLSQYGGFKRRKDQKGTSEHFITKPYRATRPPNSPKGA